jgi:phosphoheptose isomerase
MDAAIAARDLNNAGVFDSKNPSAIAKKGAIVPGKTPMASNVPSITLSDVQYQTRLQTEMVALLGLSTGFMKQLLDLEADVNHKTVNINGTKLANTLLSSARKNYAVARNEKVGAYRAP